MDAGSGEWKLKILNSQFSITRPLLRPLLHGEIAAGTAAEIWIARGENRSVLILIVLLILLFSGPVPVGIERKITIKNPISRLFSTAVGPG